MRSGFKVGRIFGSNIHIDRSWNFIFLLVTWNLAGAVFPSLHPDWDTATNIAFGVVASLLFFLSILLHELAHSLVARARGLPVSTLVYDHVMRGDERAFPVLDNERLVGMVYAENLREVDRSAWDTTTVEQVMVPENELEFVTPREDAMEAFQKLAQKEMRQIPVVQNGELVGMLRRRDILRWLQVHSEMMSG